MDSRIPPMPSLNPMAALSSVIAYSPSSISSLRTAGNRRPIVAARSPIDADHSLWQLCQQQYSENSSGIIII
jgi:hypothetical protein